MKTWPKKRKPNEIYKECLKENDVNGPRNCRQIRNIKYRAGPKESRQSHNVADDMLQILNMLHDHKYVKYIFNSKGSPMSVILYSVEQLEDMLIFIKHRVILAVDITFNLSSLYGRQNI